MPKKLSLLEHVHLLEVVVSGNYFNFEKFPMDSQLPRLHLHFALSQPIYDRATLLL
jgi:hypothetical protein